MGYVYSRELDYGALHDFKKKQKFGLLKGLDHSKISYRSFRKDFYEESEEVRDMSISLVETLR